MGLSTGLGTGLDLVPTLIEECDGCTDIENLGGVSTGMFSTTVALLSLELPDESPVGSSWIWSLLAWCAQCAHNLLTSLHCRHGRRDKETVAAIVIRIGALFLKSWCGVLCKHNVHRSFPLAIMSSTRPAFFWHCRYDCAMIWLRCFSV
jgi:hypothetical protein